MDVVAQANLRHSRTPTASPHLLRLKPAPSPTSPPAASQPPNYSTPTSSLRYPASTPPCSEIHPTTRYHRRGNDKILGPQDLLHFTSSHTPALGIAPAPRQHPRTAEVKVDMWSTNRPEPSSGVRRAAQRQRIFTLTGRLTAIDAGACRVGSCRFVGVINATSESQARPLAKFRSEATSAKCIMRRRGVGVRF